MIVTQIVAYENGEMSLTETVDFFAELIRSGLAWSLQGSYGRAAAGMIESGYISHTGKILSYPEGE